MVKPTKLYKVEYRNGSQAYWETDLNFSEVTWAAAVSQATLLQKFYGAENVCIVPVKA